MTFTPIEFSFYPYIDQPNHELQPLISRNCYLPFLYQICLSNELISDTTDHAPSFNSHSHSMIWRRWYLQPRPAQHNSFNYEVATNPRNIWQCASPSLSNYIFIFDKIQTTGKLIFSTAIISHDLLILEFIIKLHVPIIRTVYTLLRLFQKNWHFTSQNSLSFLF